MRTRYKTLLKLTLLWAAIGTIGNAKTPWVAGQEVIPTLALAPSQVQAIKSIRRRTEMRAAPFALRIATATKKIYNNMLSEKENEALRRRLSKEMNEAVVAVVNIKGQSIREMVTVLTSEQRRFVRSEMEKPGAPADLSELIMRVFKVPEK